MTTKTKLASVVAIAAVATGVTYYSVQQPAAPVKPEPKPVGILAVYDTKDTWEIPESIYEWSYRINLEKGPWQFYTNIVGTNYISVPRGLFDQCYFTITKISRKGFTNVFIVRTNK